MAPALLTHILIIADGHPQFVRHLSLGLPTALPIVFDSVHHSVHDYAPPTYKIVCII